MRLDNHGTHNHEPLDGYSYDEEDYDDLFMDMPYDFMELSDTDTIESISKDQNPYAEDMAYLEDIEALTSIDDDEEQSPLGI